MNIYDQLQAVEDRYEELGELLSDPDVVSDTKRFMELSREEANSRETVAVYREYKQVVQNIADAQEMIKDASGDPELEEMAKEELKNSKVAKEEYEEKFDMTWVGLYGQNNTYAVVVREDTAKKYNLETCSDLAAVSDQLVFGGNPDYIERADGLPGMSAAYGFQFKEIKDIDIGLKYQALRNGDIDVTNGYTTDAQISQDDVRALKDDKSYQVNYFCSTVVRKDALEKYPKLKETLELMDGILTDQKMAELNYQVEEEGRDEAEVAEEFLKTSGLL